MQQKMQNVIGKTGREEERERERERDRERESKEVDKERERQEASTVWVSESDILYCSAYYRVVASCALTKTCPNELS